MLMAQNQCNKKLRRKEEEYFITLCVVVCCFICIPLGTGTLATAVCCVVLMGFTLPETKITLLMLELQFHMLLKT